MIAFHIRLLELRRRNNITQQQLSELLGTSRATIGMYEIGKRAPDIETLDKLATFFNVSLDYLLGRTDDNSNSLYINQSGGNQNSYVNENNLPDEAIKEIEDFKQYIMYKYITKKTSHNNM